MNKLLLAILLIVNAGIANATIEQRDLIPGSNDKYITYDSTSNLEWLNLNYTKGRSFNEISNNWGGLLDKGFRYATLPELAGLTNSYGLLLNQNYTNTSYLGGNGTIFSVTKTQSLITLIQNLGATLTSSNAGVVQQEWSYGLFAYNYSDEYGRLPYLGIGYQDTNSVINSSLAIGQTSSNSLSTGYGEMGSYLIRTATVASIPEPQTYALAILGLFLLGMTRSKKI